MHCIRLTVSLFNVADGFGGGGGGFPTQRTTPRPPNPGGLG